MANGDTSTTHSLQEGAESQTTASLATSSSKEENFKNRAKILGTASGFCLARASWILPMLSGRDKPYEPGNGESPVFPDH